MSLEADLLGAFEEHSHNDIRRLLAAGVSPTEPINGKRPIDILVEMYLRSPRFAECLQVMLDAGAYRVIANSAIGWLHMGLRERDLPAKTQTARQA